MRILQRKVLSLRKCVPREISIDWCVHFQLFPYDELAESSSSSFHFVTSRHYKYWRQSSINECLGMHSSAAPGAVQSAGGTSLQTNRFTEGIVDENFNKAN